MQRASGGSPLFSVAILLIALALSACHAPGEAETSPEGGATTVEASPPDGAAPPSEQASEGSGGETAVGDSDSDADSSESDAEADAAEDEDEEPEVEASLEDAVTSFPVTGFVSANYRLRARGSRNDEDLFAYASIDAGDPAINDAVFHFFGRLSYDIEGGVNNSGFFTSLNDVQGNRLQERLYEAFVDLRRSLAPTALGVEMVRLGRQNVYAGFNYLVDGARFDFERIPALGDMRIRIYGGIPEFLYEGARGGDWLAGTDIDFKLFDETRVSFRYVHIEDDNFWIGDGSDDYAGVTIRHRWNDELSMSAEFNTVDADVRDARLAAVWNDAENDLSVRFNYRYQATIRQEFTTALDPFVAVIGDSFAYHQFDLQVSKVFGEHFALDGGLNGRVLADQSNEGPFNREYFRAFLTGTAVEWPVEKLDLAITGDFWFADGDRTIAVGSEATWRPEDYFRLSVGHYYALFKYDFLTVDERQDANTFFVRVRWKALPDLRVDARYEFETGDVGDIHTAFVGLTWSF